MFNKITQIGKYLFFTLLSLVSYGIIFYFVFMWLARYSPLYAYFGNLVLIIIVLATDEYGLKFMTSEKFISEIKKKKDSEKRMDYLQKILDNSVSFKTDLYLFYVIILISSQIIEFYPGLVSDNLYDFILANNNSILILFAFDAFISQFSESRETMKKVSEKFEKCWIENQD